MDRIASKNERCFRCVVYKLHELEFEHRETAYCKEEVADQADSIIGEAGAGAVCAEQQQQPKRQQRAQKVIESGYKLLIDEEEE